MVGRGVNNLLAIIAELEQNLADGRRWTMGDHFTLAEINYVPFIARVEALAMLDLFLEGAPLTSAWWQRCTARPSFEIANVGPAAGDEAIRYRKSGEAVLDDLLTLINRIKTTDPYTLAS